MSSEEKRNSKIEVCCGFKTLHLTSSDVNGECLMHKQFCIEMTGDATLGIEPILGHPGNDFYIHQIHQSC